MSVISFTNFYPPRRYDGLPWSIVRIEESVAATGPWTALPDITLSPLDADPSSPAPRSFTTEEATLVDGWYRVTFLDATGDASQPTEAVQNVESVSDDIRPSVQDLGSLLRARTTDNNGNEIGTFTADTRPTAAQADGLITFATDMVLLHVGENLPDRLRSRVRSVILLRAAQLVEATYYPEQANDDQAQSAFTLYGAMYAEALASLDVALQQNEASTKKPRMFSLTVFGRDGITPDPNDDLYLYPYRGRAGSIYTGFCPGGCVGMCRCW